MRIRRPAVECPNWCPYKTYTWTTKQLAAWYLKYGEWCQYDGRVWVPVTKRLGGGVVSVRFKEKV